MTNDECGMANGRWQMARRRCVICSFAEGAQEGAFEAELLLHSGIGEMLAERLEGVGFAQQRGRGMARPKCRGLGGKGGVVERSGRLSGWCGGLLAQGVGPPLLQ